MDFRPRSPPRYAYEEGMRVDGAELTRTQEWTVDYKGRPTYTSTRPRSRGRKSSVGARRIPISLADAVDSSSIMRASGSLRQLCEGSPPTRAAVVTGTSRTELPCDRCRCSASREKSRKGKENRAAIDYFQLLTLPPRLRGREVAADKAVLTNRRA